MKQLVAFLILSVILLSSFTSANFGPTQSSSASSSVQASQSNATGQQSVQQPTQQPNITTSDQNLKCSGLSTMKDRVACRINLTRENELNYVPEECGVLLGLDKAKCLNNYNVTEPCFSYSSDDDRVSCARRAIGLQVASIQQARKDCSGNQTCLGDLKSKVFSIVKFRFYNLEQKAQDMMKYGVSQNTVVNFISTIEQKKQDFNNALTVDQKKQIVQDIISLWEQFVAQAQTEAGG